MNARNKIDFVYALFSATIYTVLYLILSNLNPGVGFENSLIAGFDIVNLLLVALLLIVAAIPLGGIIVGILAKIVGLLLKATGIENDMSWDISFSCFVGILIVVYFSIALGFISIEGI